MNLDGIELPPRADDSRKIIAALEILPEGAIKGISEDNPTIASIETREGKDIIVIKSPGPTRGSLEVDFHREFDPIRITRELTSFEYQGRTYEVHY